MDYPLLLLGLIVTQAAILALCVTMDLGRKLTSIPFASLLALDNLFFWGIFPAIAYLRPKHLNLPVTMPPSTVIFILTAQVGFLLAYYTMLMRPSSIIRRDDDTSVKAARIVGWCGLLMGIAFHLIPALSALPSIPQLNRPLWLMGVGILTFTLVTRQMANTFERSLFVVVLMVKLGFELTSGYSSYFINACFVIIAVLFITRRWIALLIGAGLVALTLASYIPIKKTYNWIKGYEVFSAGGPSNSFSSMFDPGMNLDHVTRRSAQSLLLQQVIQKTPSEVPFWNGATLSGVLTNSIPRLLWKDKPEERLGNRFGQTYGIILENDASTSWNVPWLVEFYMNFGKTGAILCMIAAGALIGVLVRVIGSWSPVQQVGLASALVIPLFHPESNVSLMVGSHVWIFLVLVGAFALSQRIVPGLKRP